MKNDKHIAFTDLSFKPFSGKFVTIVHYPKPISWNVRYFTYDKMCNPYRDYDLKYIDKFIIFFKVNQIIKTTSQ